MAEGFPARKNPPGRIKNQLALAGCIALLFLVFHLLLGGKFLSGENLRVLITHSVFPAFVGWGMMFLFATDIIDLSVGANVLLSANVAALFATGLGWGYAGLIVPTLLCSVLLQRLSVHCSLTLKIPSWIAGLAMALMIESVLNTLGNAMALSAGTNIIPLENSRALGKMPLMGILWLAGAASAYFLYHRTSLGLNCRAVGGNGAVASAMGIDRRKTVLRGAVVAGVFIGLAAVVQISYNGKVYSASGLGSLATIFRALTALLLAQSCERIVNIPVGILFSSFVVTSVFNVLTLFGVPSGTWQEVFLGFIVIAGGMLSHLRYKGVVK